MKLISVLILLLLFNTNCRINKCSLNREHRRIQITNEIISNLTIAPNEGIRPGYFYKSVRLSPENLKNWKEANACKINSILNNLQTNSKLQITGHSCSDEMQRTLRKNWFSTARARFIYKTLAEHGLPENKMVFIGAGDSQANKKCNIDDICQRRVTFKIIDNNLNN